MPASTARRPSIATPPTRGLARRGSRLGRWPRRAIIGALNYLASEHVNSIYFLTMNVGGDGKDVWPWIGPIDRQGAARENDNLHFDTGKLRQWETVFDHAQRLGIFLHVVFNEAEEANKRELDDGELGPERKLYYREMIARFGHHLAWSGTCARSTTCNSTSAPSACGRLPTTCGRSIRTIIRSRCTAPATRSRQLRFTFGDPRFSMTSIQLNQRPIHEVTEAIRRETRQAGPAAAGEPGRIHARSRPAGFAHPGRRRRGPCAAKRCGPPTSPAA